MHTVDLHKTLRGMRNHNLVHTVYLLMDIRIADVFFFESKYQTPYRKLQPSKNSKKNPYTVVSSQMISSTIRCGLEIARDNWTVLGKPYTFASEWRACHRGWGSGLGTWEV